MGNSRLKTASKPLFTSESSLKGNISTRGHKTSIFRRAAPGYLKIKPKQVNI